MESREQILKEKRLTNRLHLATTRVKDMERERIWAIANAHAEGLSICICSSMNCRSFLSWKLSANWRSLWATG